MRLTPLLLLAALACLPPATVSAQKAASFPELKDRRTLLITLARSRCYGTCPEYRIEVHGDGRVDYTGACYVAVAGHRTSHIPLEAVDDLFSMFRDANFFALNDEYTAEVTDSPMVRTSISFDDQSKAVADYVGRKAGMPESVTQLEEAIDRTTNSGHWVGRDSKRGSERANKKPCY